MSNEGDPDAGEAEGDSAAGPDPGTQRKGPVDSSDWESRFKYLLADFDNFRRRTDRDRIGIRAEAEANLLRRLIPLVEGFQNAEVSAGTLPPTDPLRRGLELLGREMDTVLRSVGFGPVARVGDPFRPEEHEAVGETVGAKGLSDGAVAEIVQQGYRFQGGLLRPAKVLVARADKGVEGPTAPPAEPGAEQSSSSTEEVGSD